MATAVINNSIAKLIIDRGFDYVSERLKIGRLINSDQMEIIKLSMSLAIRKHKTINS